MNQEGSGRVSPIERPDSCACNAGLIQVVNPKTNRKQWICMKCALEYKARSHNSEVP